MSDTIHAFRRLTIHMRDRIARIVKETTANDLTIALIDRRMQLLCLMRPMI